MDSTHTSDNTHLKDSDVQKSNAGVNQELASQTDDYKKSSAAAGKDSELAAAKASPPNEINFGGDDIYGSLYGNNDGKTKSQPEKDKAPIDVVGVGADIVDQGLQKDGSTIGNVNSVAQPIGEVLADSAGALGTAGKIAGGIGKITGIGTPMQIAGIAMKATTNPQGAAVDATSMSMAKIAAIGAGIAFAETGPLDPFIMAGTNYLIGAMASQKGLIPQKNYEDLSSSPLGATL